MESERAESTNQLENPQDKTLEDICLDTNVDDSKTESFTDLSLDTSEKTKSDDAEKNKPLLNMDMSDVSSECEDDFPKELKDNLEDTEEEDILHVKICEKEKRSIELDDSSFDAANIEDSGSNLEQTPVPPKVESSSLPIKNDFKSDLNEDVNLPGMETLEGISEESIDLNSKDSEVQDKENVEKAEDNSLGTAISTGKLIDESSVLTEISDTPMPTFDDFMSSDSQDAVREETKSEESSSLCLNTLSNSEPIKESVSSHVGNVDLLNEIEAVYEDSKCSSDKEVIREPLQKMDSLEDFGIPTFDNEDSGHSKEPFREDSKTSAEAETNDNSNEEATDKDNSLFNDSWLDSDKKSDRKEPEEEVNVIENESSEDSKKQAESIDNSCSVDEGPQTNEEEIPSSADTTMSKLEVTSVCDNELSSDEKETSDSTGKQIEDSVLDDCKTEDKTKPDDSDNPVDNILTDNVPESSSEEVDNKIEPTPIESQSEKQSDEIESTRNELPANKEEEEKTDIQVVENTDVSTCVVPDKKDEELLEGTTKNDAVADDLEKLLGETDIDEKSEVDNLQTLEKPDVEKFKTIEEMLSEMDHGHEKGEVTGGTEDKEKRTEMSSIDLFATLSDVHPESINGKKKSESEDKPKGNKKTFVRRKYTALNVTCREAVVDGKIARVYTERLDMNDLLRRNIFFDKSKKRKLSETTETPAKKAKTQSSNEEALSLEQKETLLRVSKIEYINGKKTKKIILPSKSPEAASSKEEVTEKPKLTPKFKTIIVEKKMVLGKKRFLLEKERKLRLSRELLALKGQKLKVKIKPRIQSIQAMKEARNLKSIQSAGKVTVEKKVSTVSKEQNPKKPEVSTKPSNANALTRDNESGKRGRGRPPLHLQKAKPEVNRVAVVESSGRPSRVRKINPKYREAIENLNLSGSFYRGRDDDDDYETPSNKRRRDSSDSQPKKRRRFSDSSEDADSLAHVKIVDINRILKKNIDTEDDSSSQGEEGKAKTKKEIIQISDTDDLDIVEESTSSKKLPQTVLEKLGDDVQIIQSDKKPRLGDGDSLKPRVLVTDSVLKRLQKIQEQYEKESPMKRKRGRPRKVRPDEMNYDSLVTQCVKKCLTDEKTMKVQNVTKQYINKHKLAKVDGTDDSKLRESSFQNFYKSRNIHTDSEDCMCDLCTDKNREKYYVLVQNTIIKKREALRPRFFSFKRIVKNIKQVKLPSKNWQVKLGLSESNKVIQVTCSDTVSKRNVQLSCFKSGYDIIFDGKYFRLLGAPEYVETLQDLSTLLSIVNKIDPNDPLLEVKN